MRLPQSGGCQCGLLRYEITEAPRLAYACHCRDCQRLSGSAFGLAVLVPAEGFRLLRGEVLSYQRRTDSGRVSTRWVCAACGCWINGGARPGTAAPGTLVAVRAGTLDETGWVRPRVHFFTRSAQPWVGLAADTLRYATQPEGFTWQLVLDALRARDGLTAASPDPAQAAATRGRVTEDARERNPGR
ncbi:GFA family protein [Paracraurococcus lichenis]|uniref:GFA family protein n=1 Tax=Paracraurococcus lichenis TaxID=3064888 RepID=A0ABT9E1V2_9PROT|nr:GFA family protein [Paracraurococcus sp. LOR1-02]MDO9710140.1 GFA family protein [Paracraurococcus sp. LOR1-02]